MRQPGDRAPAPPTLAVVQDLTNTADLESGTDRLLDTADLAAFCAEHGITVGRLSEDDVATCRTLREAIRDTCEAHTGVQIDPASADTLRSLLHRGMLILVIDDTGSGKLAVAPDLRGIDRIIATVAAAIATAVVDGTWTRLKACVAHQCRWVYYDHSPAGRSRWCTMSICGSRAKMRAYRSRTA
jgi:predicted RNA-binding Zn ribbon-like protein